MNPSDLAVAPAEAQPIGAPRRVRSRFHVSLGLWMLAIVVLGFWPTYFAPMWRGTLTIPAVVHAHALVFLGWMTLLIVQEIAAANGTSACIDASAVGGSPAAAW
jgi:hypothetical protein